MITIVIPTLGRIQCIRDCLGDLTTMIGTEFEVIVVDQNEGASADDFRGDYGFPLRHIVLSEPNASLARNIGLYEARGDIVLFLDDDVRIENPDFLHNHERHYTDDLVPGVYGQVLEVGQAPTDRPDPDIIETDWGWHLLPPNYAQRCRTRNGGAGNLSVRRECAIMVGGMDAWFKRGARREETEFNLRYTKRYGPLVFDPEAGLVHLSAEGGSRSWGHVRRFVPMHHITGHWYFVLRAIRDRTLGLRGLGLELRYVAVALVKNPQVGRNPFIFLRNAGRAAWGLCVAFTHIVRGPRRIGTLDPSICREIGSQGGIR